jgi:hypothetical protein
MPLENWIQHSRVNLFLYDWQTVIAGVLALAAGILTVVVTMIIANNQITASRKEADRVIAATREQTEATFKQTEATVRLERERIASEAKAFRTMLAAAMTRVLDEATWAKSVIPSMPLTQTSSFEALGVRQCITKGAFAELRAACVRQGGSLTGEFLDLEREIDSFASQWEDHIFNAAVPVRWGKHAGLGEQLKAIEDKAFTLRELATRPGFSLTPPAGGADAGSS